jgi:hypothetical protein
MPSPKPDDIAMTGIDTFCFVERCYQKCGRRRKESKLKFISGLSSYRTACRSRNATRLGKQQAFAPVARPFPPIPRSVPTSSECQLTKNASKAANSVA